MVVVVMRYPLQVCEGVSLCAVHRGASGSGTPVAVRGSFRVAAPASRQPSVALPVTRCQYDPVDGVRRRDGAVVTPYYDYPAAGITIYHGDCRDVLPSLPAADLLLTDPPYGIPKGAAWWRNSGTVIADDGDAEHNVVVEGWRELVNLADNAAIVEFCGGNMDVEYATARAHVDAGWTPWRRYLLVKQAPPPTPRPTMVSGWEASIVSYVGTRRWYGSGYVPDRWIGLTPNRKNEGVHPTQKPVEPMVILIEALSSPGSLVIDPFMGSGTTLRAAMDTGRRAIGIEVNEEHCETAVSRLAQGVLPW